MRIETWLVALLLVVGVTEVTVLTATIARADDTPSSAPAAESSKAPSTAPSTAPTNDAIPTEKAAPKPAALEPRDPAASPGVSNAAAELKRIRERAAQVDPKEQEATEKSLRATASEVDAASAKKEKVEVAGRLAAEFGGIPELYLGEHERLKQGWGEIAIAHTLLASAKTTLTIDQLFDLRQEKLGWGQIAHGLDLNVGEFAKSAQAKGRSASGGAGASGKGETVEAKADAAPKGDAASSAKPAGAAAKSPAATSTSTASHGKSKK